MAETIASLEAAPEPRLNPFSTLIGVMFRPHRTFTLMREAERGYWWVVAILAIVSVLLLTVVQIPLQPKATEAVPSAAQANSVSGEQQAGIQQGNNSRLLFSIAGLVATVLGTGINYLIRAAILYLLGLAFGGRATFKQIFRMAVWTTLPDIIRNFVAAAAVLATGNARSPGLTYIFSSPEYVAASKILLAILEGIDVYLIWSLVLIAIGVAATYQLSRVKSWVVTLIYWIIGLLFTIGGAAVGQVFATLGRGG